MSCGGGTAAPDTAAAADGAASIGLEDIAGTAHGMQVARKARVELHLAAQPGHLHIDIAGTAAELRRLRQLLARYRPPGLRRQNRQEARLGRGQMHDAVAAQQLAADDIEAEPAEAHLPFLGGGCCAPFENVAY